MLASITPLGERARGAVWWRTVAAYTVASTLGAAGWGAVLGALGAVARPRPAVAAALVAVAALAAALADLTGRVPTLRRQVDERWLVTYRDWVYGAGFGVQLGLGVVTIVTSASLYLAWLVELLSGSALRGLAVGCAFGLARALPLLGVAGVDSPERLRAVHRAVARWLPRARLATIGAQLAVAVLALVVLPIGGAG